MKTKKLYITSTGKQKPEQLAEIISVTHPDIDFIHLREKLWGYQVFSSPLLSTPSGYVYNIFF